MLFEAAEKTKQKEITVQVKYLNDALYVVVQNYFEQNPVKKKRRLYFFKDRRRSWIWY